MSDLLDEMAEALLECVEWINNWDPNFIEDNEWQATAHRIVNALARYRAHKAAPSADLSDVALAKSDAQGERDDLVKALEMARRYVQAAHSIVAGAQGHERTVVKPDLDKIDAALANAKKAEGS